MAAEAVAPPPPTDPNDEILYDLFPIIRIYKSGRVHRYLGTDVVPAGLDSATAVLSKDLTINPSTDLALRIYIPSTATTTAAKLPVLLYFHGGGFLIESAFSPTYHNYLNALVAAANAVAVSVNYRRAPEHKLPAAYDDCWEALKWLSAAHNDSWISDHVDLGRVFMAGDSAGANIAHHISLRLAAEPISGVDIKGVALFHPYFWGSRPVGAESNKPELNAFMAAMWRSLWPEGAGEGGLDDHRINPLVDGAPSLEGLVAKTVVVAVAGKDVLRERGKAYCEALEKSGWGGEVRFVESEGEEHVFYLKDCEGEKAKVLRDVMVALLKEQRVSE